MKESACNAGDLGFDPWVGKTPGGGHGNPLQCSCLENPRDRGAERAADHGVVKSRTWLSDLTQQETSIPWALLGPGLFCLFYSLFYFGWVLGAVHRLPLVTASRGYPAILWLCWAGFWLQRPLTLRSTGFRSCVSRALECGSQYLWLTNCGTRAQLLCCLWDLPGPGRLSPCLLHWQADSLPLNHQGSPATAFLNLGFICWFALSFQGQID